jgi:hypothetical protein
VKFRGEKFQYSLECIERLNLLGIPSVLNIINNAIERGTILSSLEYTNKLNPPVIPSILNTMNNAIER